MREYLTEEEFEQFLKSLPEPEKKRKKRPEMLRGALPIYEHEWSEYPDRIRVSFFDGQTLVYDLHTEQPTPVVVENIRIIRKWKQGYVNKPARRRRRG